MEIPTDEKTFCYSDMHSVIERKETLKSKIALTQQRIKETRQQNSIYERMLQNELSRKS